MLVGKFLQIRGYQVLILVCDQILQGCEKKSIKNINKEHYENYFIYAYNKDLYKILKRKKLSTKHRTLKIYKN